MGGRNFFAEAEIRRFAQSRKHAVAAVELALMVCEARNATAEQLADLADAVDSLRSKQYSVAVALAEAAIEGRSKTLKAIRPKAMALSITELKVMMAEISRDGAAVRHQDSGGVGGP